MENGFSTNNNLPTKVSVWTKVRNFLCQDINFNLTEKQQKVFSEVYDFWHQEITGQTIKNFLFKEIKITGDIEL